MSFLDRFAKTRVSGPSPDKPATPATPEEPRDLRRSRSSSAAADPLPGKHENGQRGVAGVAGLPDIAAVIRVPIQQPRASEEQLTEAAIQATPEISVVWRVVEPETERHVVYPKPVGAHEVRADYPLALAVVAKRSCIEEQHISQGDVAPESL